MIRLVTDSIGLKRYNENVRRVKKENPELSYMFNEILSCEDVFVPYSRWIKSFRRYAKPYRFIPDGILNDFTGIYCCNLNQKYWIHQLTDWEIFDVSIDCGVADNASQILNAAKYDENCIVLITPIFRDEQPVQNGWRWSDGGKYIGIQNPKCEYFFDEQDIDLVFAYEIHRLMVFQ